MLYSLAVVLLCVALADCQYKIVPDMDTDLEFATLGGMFPVTGALETSGVQREAGARLAVETINAEGALLPQHTLRLISYDTGSDERTTVKAALELTDNRKVLGLIGAARSVNSQSAAIIADIYDTPQISYSSTTAALSDKVRYPTFFRTVPPDSLQARAVLDICLHEGWKRVTVLHAVGTYGASLNEVFQARAAEANVTVVRTIPIQTDGTEESLRKEMALIDGSLEKVFVVFATVEGGDVVLKLASEFGLLDDRHAFVSVDGTMQNNLLNTLSQLTVGLVGSAPSPGSSDKFRELEARWATLDPEVYAGAGGAINLYMPYAYDCVYAYAHAIAAVVGENKNLTSLNVMAALQAVDFEGVTGRVSFDESFDREGSTYDIVNFRTNPLTREVELVRIGSWADGALSYETDPEWSVDSVASVSDAIECGERQVVSADGNVCEECRLAVFRPATAESAAFCEECPSGFSPDSDNAECRLDGSLVVLIVLVVLLVVSLAVLFAFIAISRARRFAQAAEAAALNAPAEVWELVDERQEVAEETESAAGIVSRIDPSSTVSVSIKEGEVPSFGLKKGQRMPVDELLTDTIVVANRGSSEIAYTVFVPSGGDAFVCTVTPGVGTVKSRSERELTLSFTLRQTMKLDRRIKVQTEAGAIYFPLRFEGEVSQRLDPDEIELFGKPIGDGAFGTVYRGRYRGTAVAVKVLRRQNEPSSNRNGNFIKEIELFQKLRNPYIVNFIGASFVTGKLCICTELLERGTVLELIQKARISLALKYKLMLDAACAVEFLHENGVLYRDLKPDNLLVFSVSHNANVNCKLSDFGTSRTVEDPTQLMKYSGGVGTPIYMAPELMNASVYNAKVDVYSFAMLCWELMAEKQPFHEVKRVWDLPRIVVEGLRPTIDETWPHGIQRLIADCWMQSQERRPTMMEVVLVLGEMFDKERRTYEKGKKIKRKDVDTSGPQTAHTGNLEALIEQGREHAETFTTEGAGVVPAEDVDHKSSSSGKKKKTATSDGTATDSDAPAAKKKPKKKKKPAAN